MKKNTNTIKKPTENQRITDAYNAWIRSGEPAIDLINNTTLPQDPAKPYKRCFHGHDKIRKQLPKYWYIREDKTLITFKKGREILAIPHVVHTNPCMNRPCYAISFSKEDGTHTTKQIPDYDLVTLVWNPQAIYGNARRLLEESLLDNLGKRDGHRNKAHGHHYNGIEDDSIVITDTPAHDFCHNAPCTDELTEAQERKLSKDLGKIAEQEPNRATLFYKGAGATEGVLQAHKEMYITSDELFGLREMRDSNGNLIGVFNMASLFQRMGFKIECVGVID